MKNSNKSELFRFARGSQNPLYLIINFLKKRNVYLKIIIAFALSLSLAYLSAPGLPGKVPELKAGEVAPRDIIAPFDFPVYKDDETLQIERETAISEVAPIYSINHQITEIALTHNQNFFQIMGGILKKKIPTSVDKQGISLPEFSWSILANDKARADIEDAVSMMIESVMSQGVLSDRSSLESEGISSISIANAKGEKEILLSDVITIEGIEDYLLTLAEDYFPSDEEKARTAAVIARMMIRANLERNTVATKHRIDEVLSRISPIKYWVLKDEKIVEAHKRVTKEQEIALVSLNENITSIRYATIWLGRAFLILSIVTILGIYIAKTHPEIYENNRNLVAIAIILVILVFISRMVMQFITPSYNYASLLFPAAFASIIITVFFDLQAGLVMALLAGMMGGIVTGLDMGVTLSAVAGAITGSLSTFKIKHYSGLIKAGIMVVGVISLVVLLIGLVRVQPISQILSMMLWAGLGGAFSVFLAWVTIPAFERIMGLSSSIRLIGLSDLNHPLLRKLAIEAPGSYHHSINVGELASRACEVIGCNALLTRVGGYYHDIGKLKNPSYFSENQPPDIKPHDKLSPQMSSLVIKKHVEDGVDFGREWGLPDVIIDMIRKHHGTFLISFFYKVALDEDRHGVVEETDFRYPGPKPDTKESTILMIADAAESAVRSLSNPEPTNIRRTIRTIVENRLNDGQFDDSPLTLKEINKATDVIIEATTVMYHTRIKYAETGA